MKRLRPLRLFTPILVLKAFQEETRILRIIRIRKIPGISLISLTSLFLFFLVANDDADY
jgi:hypothetical protein